MVSDTLSQILELVKKMEGISTIKNDINSYKIIDIITVLLKTQDKKLKEECDVLIRTKSDHNVVKMYSDEKTFLSMEGRNKVVLGVIKACCNLSSFDLDSIADSKVKGVCVAYECILNTRNKKVLTWPAVGKNMRLLTYMGSGYWV